MYETYTNIFDRGNMRSKVIILQSTKRNACLAEFLFAYYSYFVNTLEQVKVRKQIAKRDRNQIQVSLMSVSIVYEYQGRCLRK